MAHVMSDEFQTCIYKNPDIGIDDRKDKWKELNLLYFNDTDYDGISYLEKGRVLHLIRHFFSSPLFYIYYAVATICGFQFWINSNQNNKQNIRNYLTLCEAGGSVSLEELIKLAGLRAPFEDVSIKNSTKKISKFLNDYNRL
ncbi:M3 family metallopeptidase [Bacteroidota bacterium]